MLEFVHSKKFFDLMVSTGVFQPELTSKPSEREYNASRQVRAGRKEVLTYEERRSRIKGTRLGEVLGLSKSGVS